jgi:hypothetical protein
VALINAKRMVFLHNSVAYFTLERHISATGYYHNQQIIEWSPRRPTDLDLLRSASKTPGPSRGLVPIIFRACHRLTWFVVSTGFPRSRSSRSTMLNVLQLPQASMTASASGLSARCPTSKAVCGSRSPISRLRTNPSASWARTLTPFASRNAATDWLTEEPQGAPSTMRLTESARNASSSAVEAVEAGFPLAALMRLISYWSYPGPLRDDGAVAGKMITSTSTSASF